MSDSIYITDINWHNIYLNVEFSGESLDEYNFYISNLRDEIFKIISRIKKDGTTVLLVEQNANMALSVADRAYVLETGKIIIEGNANELLNDERVRKAYLGA